MFMSGLEPIPLSVILHGSARHQRVGVAYGEGVQSDESTFEDAVGAMYLFGGGVRVAHTGLVHV